MRLIEQRDALIGPIDTDAERQGVCVYGPDRRVQMCNAADPGAPLIVTLTLQAATPETTAPFGRLLAPGLAPARRSDYYGDAVVPFPGIALTIPATLEAWPVRLHPRPLRAAYLERHPLHGQTFFSLGARPFAMILGPPDTGEALPAPDRMVALRFDGRAGFALHPGTWHEVPLALEPDTDMLLLTRAETMRDLRRKQGNEAAGADLAKRDLIARLGLVYEAVG
ncbi:ureidoglycolate lyase [Leptolyngbya sp. 15MV]|nr:ureidoglycolate lyase [Leptolyngbya sp. 15MV]